MIEGGARSALPCCGEEYWNGVKLHFNRQGEPTENGLLNHSMASSDKSARMSTGSCRGTKHRAYSKLGEMITIGTGSTVGWATGR